MELIGIGTKYAGTISGITSPKVFLFNQASRMYYKATIGNPTEGVYPYTFGAALTQKMLPGTYTLEIYNNAEDVLMGRVTDFAKAVVVANSSSQGSKNGDESEESSESSE